MAYSYKFQNNENMLERGKERFGSVKIQNSGETIAEGETRGLKWKIKKGPGTDNDNYELHIYEGGKWFKDAGGVSVSRLKERVEEVSKRRK